MSKKSMIIIIVAVMAILVLLLIFNKKSKTEKNKSNNQTNNEVSRDLEVDEHNIDEIESIYYVDPNYNPRFPDELEE